MSSSINCISLNCRGLNSYEKRTYLYDWVKDNNIDIACLQETHFVEKSSFKYDARWQGQSFHSYSDTPHGRGVTVLFKDKFEAEIINVYKSLDGRRILINFKTKDIVYTLINIYAPNTENARIDFFKRLKTWISQHAANDSNIIFVGDFNCAMSCKDRYLQTVNNDKSSRILQELLDYLDVKDLWRQVNPDKEGFTWCDGDNIPKSRIDYVFVSNDCNLIFDKFYTRKPPKVKSVRMSDHLSLRFQMKYDDFTRGTNYWKLNTSLLTDQEYCTSIRNMLTEQSHILENIEDKQQKWERVKLLIKNTSVDFSKRKSKSIKQKICKIEKELESIETSSYNEIDMNRKRKLEQELDEIYENKTKGAYVRSKAKWIEKGERNSSYFFTPGE